MHEQGSDAWKAERAGKVTASRMGDLCARTKSGYSASRANYMAQLIAETLTGVPADSYINAAMQNGIDMEPSARAEYEAVTGAIVAQVGFIPHPTIAGTGASPDGLIGSDGLVEIKCPNTATHIETLLSGEIDRKYILQMQWQMTCTGRAWCDFVSFDHRMPASMRLFVKRILRDEKIIADLESETVSFLAEMRQKIAELRAKFEPLPEAA